MPAFETGYLPQPSGRLLTVEKGETELISSAKQRFFSMLMTL